MTDISVDWSQVSKEAVDILSRYLRVNTTNPPGNETQGARFLKEILEREQIYCDIFESKPGRGSVISRFTGQNDFPEIITLHHLDVVPAEEEKWIHPPFSGLVVEGQIWGRGSVDCKSLGIAELMAFILLKRGGYRPENSIVYAATADEEAGGTWGVPWLMENHPQRLRTKYVINEGVGMGISTDKHNVYFCQTAEKGACWIRINFAGTPGHGSQPREDNCVVDMAKGIVALSSHDFAINIVPAVRQFIENLADLQDFMPQQEFMCLADKEKSRSVLKKIPEKTFRQMLSAMLQNTATPTVVRAGTKNNVIPGGCCCDVDCRILPGSEPEQLLDEINRILKKAGCRNFSVEFQGKSVSSESPADTPLYGAIERSFLENDPKAKMIPYMSTGATDSRFFRQKGIPAYGIQMASSVESIRGIHGHNEHINVETFVNEVKVLYDILKVFCS